MKEKTRQEMIKQLDKIKSRPLNRGKLTPEMEENLSKYANGGQRIFHMGDRSEYAYTFHGRKIVISNYAEIDVS